MKFTCYKKDLVDALQLVIKAVAVKPMTPVLAGVYLKAEGSVLELHANNFSTGIRIKIAVNTEIAGEVVVNGKRFQDFVRNMSDDIINFSNERDENILSMDCNGSGVELLTLPVADFPKVKTPETDKNFRVQATALRNLIRKTVFAVAKDESRPIFTGGAFEISGEKISLVATNTHRLALASEKLTESYEPCSFIVPAETLRSLIMRLDPRDVGSYIDINYSTRNVTFSFDNVFITSRLIEGQFPPYDRVIPSSSTTRATVTTEKFKEAIEFVSLMSKETEYNTVKLLFTGDNLEISSNSPEVGGAVKNIEAAVEGDNLEISFNVDYLADVARVIDTEQLNIALNDRFSPAAFTEPDNENYIYVATPVRA